MRTTLILALSTLSLLAQAPAKKDTPKPAAVKTEAKPAPAAAFIGNKDSKVYHKAGCKLAAKMKAENKTTFATKEEAEKAGYKACKTCCK